MPEFCTGSSKELKSILWFQFLMLVFLGLILQFLFIYILIFSYFMIKLYLYSILLDSQRLLSQTSVLQFWGFCGKSFQLTLGCVEISLLNVFRYVVIIFNCQFVLCSGKSKLGLGRGHPLHISHHGCICNA